MSAIEDAILYNRCKRCDGGLIYGKDDRSSPCPHCDGGVEHYARKALVELAQLRAELASLRAKEAAAWTDIVGESMADLFTANEKMAVASSFGVLGRFLAAHIVGFDELAVVGAKMRRAKPRSTQLDFETTNDHDRIEAAKERLGRKDDDDGGAG